MRTAAELVCLVAVGGAVAYGAMLVYVWALDFCRDLFGALRDDPRAESDRDAREEN